MDSEYFRLHKNSRLAFHVSYEAAIFLKILNIFSFPRASYEQFMPQEKCTHFRKVCEKFVFLILFQWSYYFFSKIKVFIFLLTNATKGRQISHITAKNIVNFSFQYYILCCKNVKCFISEKLLLIKINYIFNIILFICVKNVL